MKAIFESHCCGPVKVEVLHLMPPEEMFPEPYRKAFVRVVGNGSRTYPKGYEFYTALHTLWLKHRFIGQFKHRSEWTGRPDFSNLETKPWPTYR